MLENAPRQIALVVVLIIASVASLFYKPLNWGNDLAGGTELIYEINEEDVTLEKDTSWDDFMATTVSTISSRIDPEGTLNAEVLRRGRSGIYVGLPKVTERESLLVEEKVTRLGSLEMQICAYETYEADDGKQIFDLAKERDRLKAWLKLDDNEEKLKKNPMLIERFHLTSTEDGGPMLPSSQLRWVPHKIEGRVMSDGARGDTYDGSLSQGTNALCQYVVTLFKPEERSGKVEEGGFLLEYVPVNYDEQGFTGKDLIADRVVPSTDSESGGAVVRYEIIPEKKDAYAQLSEDNVGNQSAIILDGFIKSAPVYISRIPGSGQIQGFTIPEAQALSDTLKRGSLQVKPVQQSKRTIGPTLGAESISRGMWSLIIGAGVVLIFILIYYRLAGMIATFGILLNVGFVFGAVSFIGATLTLPGLGGLVLTVGMAIDANILIYERIREELRADDDLQRSIRHGFERAMVTILDANITTFIAGLVLYNVGVGPIKGFAVTLMIGIVTSLFTAFFVSRLIFHFLLSRPSFKLNMSDWFGGLRFNFLAFSKPAFVLSAIVIIGGIAAFFTTPANTKYALDFTGGADIRVVTKEAMTPQEIKAKLTAKESSFAKLLGADIEPMINTVDSAATGGKAKKFSVKIKVDDAFAAKIEADRLAAKNADKVYVAPYVNAVAETLQDLLVPKAYTGAKITAPRSDSRVNYAQIVVHYSKPVEVAKVRSIVKEALAAADEDLDVDAFTSAGKPDSTKTQAQDLLLQFDVAPSIKTPQDLERFTANILRIEAKDEESKKAAAAFELSNPIPDVATLGGRMVGELKSKAVTAMILALFFIVMYIRLRFREYKYGFGAVAALTHDVLVALGLVVLFNRFGLVSSELSLSMIAAFLTIIGYSINDTIVIFDRVRENLRVQAAENITDRSFADTINLSINQTLGRTILTSFTTLFVVAALFVVNYGAGSELEGFAFAMIIGVVTGTYSTIFIASPVVLWLRSREKPDAGLSEDGGLSELGPIEEAVDPLDQSLPAPSNS